MSRRILSAATLLGVLISLLTISGPSSAATSPYYYKAFAGGSQIAAIGTTISSDLTGASTIAGFSLPASDTNTVTEVDAVDGLVNVKAIDSYANATAVPNGVKVASGGRTAEVSLLGGLITATAVRTDTTTTKTSTSSSSTSHTTFVDLSINGKSYPASVPRNTSIVIPGVATIVLNGWVSREQFGGIVTRGFGLYAQLLKPFSSAPAGATVLLNPSFASATPTPPAGLPQLGGYGWSTFVDAEVPSTLRAYVGPTAVLLMPPSGTNGATIENGTVKVRIPNVLTASGARSEGAGTSLPGFGDVTMSNRIADLRLFPNLLGALVSADAILSRAHARWTKGSPVTCAMTASFVNLKLGGRTINGAVGPNTTINVTNLGKVVLNKQHFENNMCTVLGAEVTLTRARGGLPVGAIIQLAGSSAYIIPAS